MKTTNTTRRSVNNSVKDMNRPTLLNAAKAAAFVNVRRRDIRAWLRKRNIFFFTIDNGGEGDILVSSWKIREQLRKPHSATNH